MNLIQHLNQLDHNKLMNIAKKNRLTSIEKQPIRSFLIRQINNFLLDYRKSYWIYDRISAICKIALYQVLYSDKTIYSGHLTELQEYGVCINGKIPNDLSNILGTSLRNEVVRTFPDYKHKVLISYFAKTVQLLKIILMEQNIRLDFRKKKQVKKLLESNNLAISEIGFLKNMIDYFLIFGLVSYENNVLTSNSGKIVEWFESYPNNFKEFYQWILNQVTPEILDLLKKLAILQQESIEWVNISALSATISTNLSIEKCEKTGLLEFAAISNHHYVQLTNEGWFFTKGESPPYWLEKNLLVSAAFEIFVPYNYDKIAFNYFALYGSLKSNDFYSVFDLDIPRDSSQIRKMIHNLLVERARYVPDIVRYELNR